jgi:hypothetical protein
MKPQDAVHMLTMGRTVPWRGCARQAELIWCTSSAVRCLDILTEAFATRSSSCNEYLHCSTQDLSLSSVGQSKPARYLQTATVPAAERAVGPTSAAATSLNQTHQLVQSQQIDGVVTFKHATRDQPSHDGRKLRARVSCRARVCWHPTTQHNIASALLSTSDSLGSHAARHASSCMAGRSQHAKESQWPGT